MSQNLSIREYLKDNILVTDGALGTYYTQLTGDDTSTVETANLVNPEAILDIHRTYIAAGAKLIRTNTFAANTTLLKLNRAELKELLVKGYKLAEEACNGDNIYIAADIGPVPEFANEGISDLHDVVIDEYKFIIDTFLENGADIFCFETFSNTYYLDEITRYLKEKNRNTFIMVQFALLPGGVTCDEISAVRITEEIKANQYIDAFGFNCGTGPTHLYQNLRHLNLKDSIVSVLPNAGFPKVINGRTVYTPNADYFADIVLKFRELGVRIIGGCCGTTPLHIKKITEKLARPKDAAHANIASVLFQPIVNNTLVVPEKPSLTSQEKNPFAAKLNRGDFVIAVELDPPSDHNIEKLICNADILKKQQADLITLSDSPLGKMRVNSIMMASKIKREVAIETMPHICCRDRNALALKSDLLAAYIEGIRNILLVTGDPIPALERNDIKSIFNLNSFQLINLAREMNAANFAGDPIFIGAALNLNVLHKELEFSRMERKIKNGAAFFLTQPVFDDEAIEFLARIKESTGMKILAGIIPLVSLKNAQFLNNEITGIRIPENYIQKFTEDMPREEAEEIGIDIAAGIIKKLRLYVDGLYLITPFNRVKMIGEIIKKCEV